MIVTRAWPASTRKYTVTGVSIMTRMFEPRDSVSANGSEANRPSTRSTASVKEVPSPARYARRY